MRTIFTSVILFVSIVLISLSVVGCSKVTIQPTPLSKKLLNAHSTYQQSKHYYLWGLVGEEHMDVRAACNGGTPSQIQAQTTFIDGLLGAVTFGIYAPRTISVWCS